MSDRLIQLERNLRSAVVRCRYTEIQQAATAFCEQAAAEWQALPPGDPAARRVFKGLEGVLEWARLMLCVSRATTAAELQRLLLSNRYLDAGTMFAGRLRLDA